MPLASFIRFLSCVCSVYACVYVLDMDAHLCAGRLCVCVPKIDIMCLLGHPSSYLLRQGSCLNPELTCTLVEVSRLVQQCCFCPLPSGILGKLPCPPNIH